MLFGMIPLLAALLFAPLQVESSPPPPTRDEVIVTTRHSISLNGRRLGPTARVGRLPIIDNTIGEPHAQVFFVAYSLEGFGKHRSRRRSASRQRNAPAL